MAGWTPWGTVPDAKKYDPYAATRNQMAANPYPVNPTPAYSAFQSPTKSFGGLQFSNQPTGWSSYLGNLTNEQDASALGLNGPETPDNMNEAWNRYLAMNSESMSPNALNALNQNRYRVNAAFNQARASQPNVRYAQFLGGVDPNQTVNAWSPQTAFRPVTFRRVRVSGG